MLRAIDWKKEFSDKEKKIYIRPMTYGDVPDFVRWRNSEEVRKFYIYRGVFTVESQTAWMKANIDTGRAASMIVCEEENDRPIGCVYLQNIDKTHNKAEYGVLVVRDSHINVSVGFERFEKLAIFFISNCFHKPRLSFGKGHHY